MIRDFCGRGPKIAPSVFISEAAYVIGDVEIAENSNIWPGAVVRGDFGKIIIGKNTSLEDNCVIHSATDVIIGNDVIVGHGAIVHCSRIGNNVLVGNNATILDNVEIGNFCIISAGSLVLPNTKIPDKSFAIGMPARIKNPISPRQLIRLKKYPAYYTKLAHKYKQQGL